MKTSVSVDSILVYHTKRLAFEAGLRQCCSDIIRFSRGASFSALHDVCMILERTLA